MSDLSDLFARDPLSYTKEQGELAAIIDKMRASRKQFTLGNMKAGTTKAPKNEPKLDAATLSLIDKLDLSL
jgi:hypothetical protein